jgi:hypothetical protein
VWKLQPGAPSLFSPCEECLVPHPLQLERAQHAGACGQSQRVGDNGSRILTGFFAHTNHAALLDSNILVRDCNIADLLALSIDVVSVYNGSITSNSKPIRAIPVKRQAVAGSIEDNSVAVIRVSKFGRRE